METPVPELVNARIRSGLDRLHPEKNQGRLLVNPRDSTKLWTPAVWVTISTLLFE